MIPPAWNDVWICAWPQGHIQATGVDARGRTQYRYHDAWRVLRDQAKFDHVLDFGRALPALRGAVDRDLRLTGAACDRVLAVATRLLDIGFFRIGSECYAEENDTYGLTTLRRRHARVVGDEVVFDYPAKDGKRRLQAVVDSDVRDVITMLRQRRSGGDNLFAWQERPHGPWREVRSADINAYVKNRTGFDCSAKDFRTWHATVLAAVALSVSVGPTSPWARKRCVSRAMQEVAYYLGDTPRVTRRSYVDPRVVDRYLAGQTVASALGQLGSGLSFGDLSTQGAVEEAVLDLLDPRPAAERRTAS